MPKKLRKLWIVLTISITIVSVFTTFPVTPTQADDLEQQLSQIEKELEELRNEKDSIQQQIDSNNYLIDGLNSQASELYGEILIFQKEIDELELQIKELEVSIQVLNQRIEENTKNIAEGEETIKKLENESDSRLENNYMKYRVYGTEDIAGANLFNVDSINEYFKTVQYRDIIQEDTNDLMTEVSTKRQELIVKKRELEEQKLQVEKDRELIEIKRTDMDKKKGDLEIRMAEYRTQINAIASTNEENKQVIAAFSQDEAQLERDAESIRYQIFSSFNPTTTGEYVAAGRIIGQQGCTGLCTGPHLHFSVQYNGGWQDPCAYLKPGPVSGCGWGSQLDWPISAPFYYTSAYGNRCFMWGSQYYCDFHTGADFQSPYAGAPIYAAHNGYAYKGVDPYGANYVIVCENTNCNQGIKTGYWHLSSF